MMTYSQMAQKIREQDERITKLEEQLAALSPRAGMKGGMFVPLTDREHVGYLADIFEHGSKAIETHKRNALCRRAQRSYHIDPSGRIGRDQKVVVEDSTGEWVAVDAYVK